MARLACLAIGGDYEILGRSLGPRVGVHVVAAVRGSVFVLVLSPANYLVAEEGHIHGACENLV